MMINTSNYAEIIAKSRANGDSIVNFNQNTHAVNPIFRQEDTLTLSDQALAKLNGQEVVDHAPTYIKPESARSLLTQTKSSLTENEKMNTDDRFGEMMQSILDQRLGVDREKLAEIDTIMEEITKNKSMSSEEKAKILEELSKMKEKIIQDSIDIRKTAEKTFNKNNDQ